MSKKGSEHNKSGPALTWGNSDEQETTRDMGDDEHNERPTPRVLARQLKTAVGGQFDLDPAAGCEATPLAATCFTGPNGEGSLTPMTGYTPVDGLEQAWFGRVFVNPPYGRGELDDWLGVATDEIQAADGPELVVALLPAWTSPDWFHDNVVAEAAYLCLLDDRLDFGDTGQGAPFASMIAVFDGADGDAESNIPRDLLAVLERRGAVYELSEDTPAIDGEQVGFEAFGGTQPARNDAGVPATGRRVSGEHLLSTLAVGDRFALRLDDRTMGFPADVRADVEVAVLTVEVDEDASPTRCEVLTVGPAPDDAIREETYYLIQFPEEAPEAAAVSVSETVEARGNGWQDVQLAGIERTASTTGPGALSYIQ